MGQRIYFQGLLWKSLLKIHIPEITWVIEYKISNQRYTVTISESQKCIFKHVIHIVSHFIWIRLHDKMLAILFKIVLTFLLFFVTIDQKSVIKCTTENIHHTSKLTIVYNKLSYRLGSSLQEIIIFITHWSEHSKLTSHTLFLFTKSISTMAGKQKYSWNKHPHFNFSLLRGNEQLCESKRALGIQQWCTDGWKHRTALRNSKGTIQSMTTQSNTKNFHLQVKTSPF